AFQCTCHGFFDGGTHFAGYELVLGLAAEFGLGYFDRQHAGQAFAHIIARGFDLGLLGQLVVGDVLVDDPRHRCAQTRHMGTAVTLRDVIGKAQYRFAVRVVPLHGDLDTDRHTACTGLGRHRKDIRVQHGLCTIDVFHKTAHAT